MLPSTETGAPPQFPHLWLGDGLYPALWVGTTVKGLAQSRRAVGGAGEGSEGTGVLESFFIVVLLSPSSSVEQRRRWESQRDQQTRRTVREKWHVRWPWRSIWGLTLWGWRRQEDGPQECSRWARPAQGWVPGEDRVSALRELRHFRNQMTMEIIVLNSSSSD